MGIPKMPTEFKGEVKKNGGYTTSQPREWTSLEIAWVKKLLDEGYSYKEIAESVDRTPVSVSIKVKRLGKKENTYNQNHVMEKYDLNALFMNMIQPKTICDAYCGQKSFYRSLDYDVVTNDLDLNIEADYHMDAFCFMCEMFIQGKSFDLVDLDPFGSAYDSFDLAVKMAKKGVVITLGELGHKRWKRLDFVSRYYGINSLEDFTIENLIEHIQMIGERNKKKLTPVFVKEWRNTGRVYFKIEPIKIVEQWENKNF